MKAISVALLILAPAATGAVFTYDETLDGDISDNYLAPALLTPGAGASVLKGTVVDGDRDLFTLVIASGLRLDSLKLLSYVTDSENPDNLSYMMSQPGATLSSPPSNDFADAVGYVGFGKWAEGRNILGTITAGPPYDYASTLGAGSYAFWINETGPTSSYQFQFNVSAVPEPSVPLCLLPVLATLLRRRRRVISKAIHEIPPNHLFAGARPGFGICGPGAGSLRRRFTLRIPENTPGYR